MMMTKKISTKNQELRSIHRQLYFVMKTKIGTGNAKQRSISWIHWMVMTTTIRTKSPKHISLAKDSLQFFTIFLVDYYCIVLIFNTFFVDVKILFVLLHFPVFVIPK
jgi:hypothetical protein